MLEYIHAMTMRPQDDCDDLGEDEKDVDESIMMMQMTVIVINTVCSIRGLEVQIEFRSTVSGQQDTIHLLHLLTYIPGSFTDK